MKKDKLLKTWIIILLIAVIDLGLGTLMFHQSLNHITVRGDRHIEVNLCQIYEDPGALAFRAGIDVSDKVKISGSVDTETPGTYKVTYSVAGMTAERTVTVSDTMDPVLELSGGSVEMKLGEEYPEPGYAAYSADGSDLTSKVEVDTSAVNEAGEHEIIYTVYDDTGKGTRVTRDISIAPNTDYGAPGLPICMYHYVYDENDPPDDLQKRYGNYIEQDDLEEELNWLKDEGYYFPTWEEVRRYVDGELLLPEKSIVITFDDGAYTFLEYGIPVIEECQVPVTCFMITANEGKSKIAAFSSDYVTYESHSHNMHRGGGSIGHGGIFTALPEKKALEDLAESIEICGSNDAFAYPFGDYTDECSKILEEAGFLCAVTTEYGKARPGMDPYKLPRLRMMNDQSMAEFKDMVSP